MSDDLDLSIELALAEGTAEAALRPMFGDDLYEELSALAQAAGPPGADQPTLEGGVARQRVILLPGIMGSKLAVARRDDLDAVWIDPGDIISGGIDKLRLQRSNKRQIVPTGVMLHAYLKMKLRLRLAGFDPVFKAYDWRLPPAKVGDALFRDLKEAGETGVALVGHSMGGLVARQAAARDPDGAIIDRVITVGTPNRGSYSPVEIMRLTHAMLHKLAAIDLRHDAEEIVSDVVRHFPGLMQMLPDPALRPGQDWFDTAGWPTRGGVKPLVTVLRAALKGAADLPPPDARFRQIVGVGENTIVDAKVNAGGVVFERGRDGDGTVPRDLAEMDGDHGAVPRWYVEGAHGALMNRKNVFEAVRDILRGDATDALPLVAPEFGLLEAGVPGIDEDALREERLREIDHPSDSILLERDLMEGLAEALAERPVAAATLEGGVVPGAAPEQVREAVVRVAAATEGAVAPGELVIPITLKLRVEVDRGG